jgi:hypothetical protein
MKTELERIRRERREHIADQLDHKLAEQFHLALRGEDTRYKRRELIVDALEKWGKVLKNTGISQKAQRGAIKSFLKQRAKENRRKRPKHKSGARRESRGQFGWLKRYHAGGWRPHIALGKPKR